jgi:hypothetical protein
MDIVFIDGPIVLHPVDLDGSSAPTSLAALGASEVDTASSDPSATPRAWWKSNPERTVAHGMEDSLLYLRDILRRDRYDVSILQMYMPYRAKLMRCRVFLVSGDLPLTACMLFWLISEMTSQGAAMAALLSALVRGSVMYSAQYGS